MPWLIKTKGRSLHARDGSGPDRPLYVLDDTRWYPFEHLPPGTDPDHDGDLLCRETDSLDGHKPAPLFAELELMRQMESEERAAKAAEAKAAAPAKPEKRKPRVRGG